MKKSTEIQTANPLGVSAPESLPLTVRELLDHLESRHEALIREASARAFRAAQSAPDRAGRFGLH